MDPVGGEEAQVDLGAEHHGGMGPALIAAVDAAPLVHAAFVPGQGKDIAKRCRPGDQPVGIGVKPGHPMAQMGGDQRGLGNAQVGGKVADALPGFVGPCGTQRLGAGKSGHQGTVPCCRKTKGACLAGVRQQDTKGWQRSSAVCGVLDSYYHLP